MLTSRHRPAGRQHSPQIPKNCRGLRLRLRLRLNFILTSAYWARQHDRHDKGPTRFLSFFFKSPASESELLWSQTDQKTHAFSIDSTSLGGEISNRGGKAQSRRILDQTQHAILTL
jgi:hypothetical protein